MRSRSLAAILLLSPVLAFAQESAEAVSFDLAHSCYGEPTRLDLVLLILGAARAIAWLTGRPGIDAASLATAFTAAFLVLPFSVSWIVNLPAMLLLALIGDATPWQAVALVWIFWFSSLTAVLWFGRRGSHLELGLASVG